MGICSSSASKKNKNTKCGVCGKSIQIGGFEVGGSNCEKKTVLLKGLTVKVEGKPDIQACSFECANKYQGLFKK